MKFKPKYPKIQLDDKNQILNGTDKIQSKISRKIVIARQIRPRKT